MTTYCFDLDGTLCTSTNGKYETAEPFTRRIRIVNKLYDEGNTIIIETARGSSTGIDWSYLTKTQLDEWNLRYHTLRVGKKIEADFYIDDRAIEAAQFFKLSGLI